MLEGKDKPVVLVFVSYYFPAYKAGGPLRTIYNMVECLSSDFEFWIVTSDRDLGDEVPFPSVTKNKWQKVGEAHVYYASPEKRTVKQIAGLISGTPHNILYLNSFFSSDFSIKPLLACKIYGASQQPTILAPRGEFSLGALALKGRKKSWFIKVGALLGLYTNVVFQASSEYELNDIIKVLRVPKKRIGIAIDLPGIQASIGESKQRARAPEPSNTLKVIFLSRLSPMKNLDFALKALQPITKSIQFDIYGPREDDKYWSDCQKLMENLPENVDAKYCGSVSPGKVRSIFAQYDLFLFPTRGENYGHVIAESLSVGTPVLISDQTPWENLESDGLGWSFPLVSLDSFTEKIEELAFIPQAVRNEQRLDIKKKAVKRLLDPEIVAENRKLFYSVLQKVN